MRRNSGKDEGRNNFLDPTMKEHERERGKSGEAVLDKERDEAAAGTGETKTTGLGSNARKSGQDGDRR